jgi:carbonic anhydrase
MKKIVIAIQFVLAACATAFPAERAKENGGAIDTVQALKRLQEGNARFVAGRSQHPHETSGWRHALEGGQHPFAVVLGCSDSRVPPELVFDQGFGDLFVVRIAGNVVDTDVTASIEYAVDHLDTQLIVVMGHSSCGAVSATVDHLENPDGEPAEVVSLMYRIEPAIAGSSPDMSRQERIDRAIKRNVELAVRRLSRVPDLRRSIAAGRIKIVGAVYDMHTGKVAFLKEPKEQPKGQATDKRH